MKFNLLIALISLCFTSGIYAAETVVKEETTPPAAEGAITIDQIPPATATQAN